MCAHGVLRAAALLAALLAALPAAAHELEDDDSDGAAFMIVLEHADGWQCAASLVSLRTGVTTARCARGSELWALAAALLGARPPAPPAAAARRVTRVARAGDGRDPADPALDIAVFEMEAPFGAEAQARPILMATVRGDREETTECYAVRALPALVSGEGAKRARFRVVNLTLASDSHCAALVPHWSASRARLLCFIGDELCERDIGGGVVCDGRLYGVLGAVARGAAQCGDTYAVQNIARWRSFLHCAHTLRRCGRGSCSEECSEQLLDEKEGSTIMESTNTTLPIQDPPRTWPTASSAPPRAASPQDVADDPVSHPSLEFEPNRADFKAAPTRTTRPRLKAGEYGDHAAEYGADDAPPPARPARTSPAASPRAAVAAPHAPLTPALRALSPSDSVTSAFVGFHSASMLRLLIYCSFVRFM